MNLVEEHCYLFTVHGWWIIFLARCQTAQPDIQIAVETAYRVKNVNYKLFPQTPRTVNCQFKPLL